MMELILKGKNSEDMLGKKSKTIRKYRHNNKYFTVVAYDKKVYVEFIDSKICEQGEVLNFMNRYEITREEFNKLNSQIKPNRNNG